MAKPNPESQLAVKLFRAGVMGAHGVNAPVCCESCARVEAKAVENAARLMSMARSLRRYWANPETRVFFDWPLLCPGTQRIGRLKRGVLDILGSYGLNYEVNGAQIRVHFPDGSANGDGPGWSI